MAQFFVRTKILRFKKKNLKNQSSRLFFKIILMFFMILASYTLFLVHVKKNWNLTLLRVNLTGWVDYPPPPPGGTQGMRGRWATLNCLY